MIDKQSRQTFPILVLITFASLFVYFVIVTTRTVYSFDESYTMALIRYSFVDIWRITSLDVHPPLYYFMLKSFTFIFGETQLAARVFSWLAVVGIFLLGLFPIRRFWGDGVCLCFILLMSILPVIQFLVVDIRMYSWVMFFITAASLSAYSIFIKPKMSVYAILVFTTLCASYIQYYGFVGSMVIFFLLFIALFLSNQRHSWTRLIPFFLLFLIGFSFWLPALITQIRAVDMHFWITSITPKDILLFTYYTFSPKEPAHPYFIFSLPQMAAVLSLMLILLGLMFVELVVLYKQSEFRKSILTAMCFALVFVLPISFALLYSYIKSPVIIPRYTTTVLGPMLIAVSIGSAQILKREKERYLIFIFFGLLTVLGITRFFAEDRYNEEILKEDREMRKFISNETQTKRAFISTLNAAGILGWLSVNCPSNLFFVYSPRKNRGSLHPFHLIEVNRLPEDFDFFYIRNRYLPTDTVGPKQDLYFRSKIKQHYIITDSLIQYERSIYKFRTIHRDRENISD